MFGQFLHRPESVVNTNTPNKGTDIFKGVDHLLSGDASTIIRFFDVLDEAVVEVQAIVRCSVRERFRRVVESCRTHRIRGKARVNIFVQGNDGHSSIAAT